VEVFAQSSADDVRAPDARSAAPQSVTRVIRILEALCGSTRPLSLAELSRTVATPKSSLAALLRGLADEHLVVPVEGAWRLGPGAFGLGSALVEARRRFPAAELVREGMRRLSDRAGETALFAVPDAGQGTMTYVDVAECSNAVRFSVAVGDRRPLYATAGGRMLLTAASDAELEHYLAQLRPQARTARTETDRARLAEAVSQARRRGVAQTVDQASDGVTGTAALVRDARGQVLGALILAAPSQRSTDRLAELVTLVSQEAAAISRSLGYRGGAEG
jgi:DNA-binding IclR family transcriptional regulator